VHDRILAIVVYLMNCLSEPQAALNNFDEMSADLRSMGYPDNEISSAYSWLLKHFEEYPDNYAFSQEQMKGSRAVRILSETEKKVISPEAYGYLMHLRHLGLLTAEQLEMILDRSTLFGTDPIDIDEIKIMASAAMFDGGSSEYPYAVWVGDPENEPIN
jgi:Smg protein